MRRLVIGALVIAAALAAAVSGCGTSQTAAAVAEPPVARAPRPVLPVEQLEAAEAGTRDFAVRLYQKLASKTGNLCVSPYSISSALAMTYAGARGTTEQEMARTLGFTVPQEQVHATFHTLSHNLTSEAAESNQRKADSILLRQANALWGDTRDTFLPAYLDVLGQNYGAGLRQVDFGQAEAARKTINDWVQDQTQGKITDLITRGVLTPQTSLVLTNALYFKARWAEEFREANTSPAAFTLLDGTKVNVPTMHGTLQRAHYGVVDGVEAITLPYRGERFVMTIVMPPAGKFREFEAGLTAQRLDLPDLFHDAMVPLPPPTIQLSLPKFTFTSAFSLKDTLSAMGMPNAFGPGADFSGMDGKRDLFISAVLHKAFIGVNEQGTEAAAATAVVMQKSAAPRPPLRVNVDRPFVFLIRDGMTGTVLFLGRVLDPRG